MISEVAQSNKEEYSKFYKEFSKCLKLVFMKMRKCDRLAKLIRFANFSIMSTESKQESECSFEEYVKNEEGQEHIYYCKVIW